MSSLDAYDYYTNERLRQPCKNCGAPIFTMWENDRWTWVHEDGDEPLSTTAIYGTLGCDIQDHDGPTKVAEPVEPVAGVSPARQTIGQSHQKRWWRR